MKKLNIIDFEASSLVSPSFPTQVAVIKEDGSTFDRFIKPSSYWQRKYNWSLDSQKIHGMSLSFLIDVGVDINVVADELNSFVDGEEVFCDGGMYDINWANELFESAKVKQTFRIGALSELFDASYLSAPMWELKLRAAENLGLKEHDALNDVKIIQTAVKYRRSNMYPRKN